MGKGYIMTFNKIPRHRALVNTSVEDCRSSLNHETDLETVKKAIRLELDKGGDARATMVKLLKAKIRQLEKGRR